MDGVMYKGTTAIPGAADAVATLQNHGLKFVALTNNARASAMDYSTKLAGLGIDLPAAMIITAGAATAQFLASQSVRSVYIAGSDALRRELHAVGIREAGDTGRPDYVVAGFDMDMTLATLSVAVGHLHRGAKLVATNPDTIVPGSHGVEPEAGAVIAFLEAASGQTAYIIGKPNKLIFQQALAKLELDGAEVAVVGDTAMTDIAGATAAGLRSIQVASGNPIDPNAMPQPTMQLADLAGVAKLLTDL
jgi:NagD protein